MEKLRAEDPKLVDSCSAAAGLSLGEYCALVFAGALSFEDGLKVRTPVTTHDARWQRGGAASLPAVMQQLVSGML